MEISTKNQDPQIKLRMQEIEKHTQDYLQRHEHLHTGTITIPVVVHVVYKTNAENIPDAQVLSQIEVLNEDFRRLNGDTTKTRSVFEGVAADIEVEFCLATVGPDGSSTSGITRTNTNKKSFSYQNEAIKSTSMGGHDAWPAGDYLNIWVGNLRNGLLGYAQFPGGDPATDGVVLHYRLSEEGRVIIFSQDMTSAVLRHMK